MQGHHWRFISVTETVLKHRICRHDLHPRIHFSSLWEKRKIHVLFTSVIKTWTAVIEMKFDTNSTVVLSFTTGSMYITKKNKINLH